MLGPSFILVLGIPLASGSQCSGSDAGGDIGLYVAEKFYFLLLSPLLDGLSCSWLH